MIENTEKLKVSVVIPTHNPRADYLRRTLVALRGQTMPREQWELVVVDNCSQPELRVAGLRDQGGAKGQRDQGVKGQPSLRTADGPKANGLHGNQLIRDEESKSPKDHKAKESQAREIDLGWHGNARLVREERLGLTFARLRGFAEARGELIVMVDDDNLLAPDYLETAVRIAEERPMLGAFGGKCLPEFEVEPPTWIDDARKALGLRDRGDREELFPREHTASGIRQTEGAGQEAGDRSQGAGDRRQETGRVTRRVTEFPDCAPIGAGMVLRRDAAAAYAKRIEQQTKRLRDKETITDRKGDSLASGGDNDICLTVIEEGWQVGYLSQLQLTHLIPAARLTAAYHKRAARESMQSFVLMMDQHGLRPWPAIAKWTVPLRMAREFFRHKAWRGDLESMRWWGSVGQCLGQARLQDSQHQSHES